MPRSDPSEIRATTARIAREQPSESPRPRRLIVSLGPLQQRQLDESNFVDLSDPVRHLTYHVCPFANSPLSWKWNLDQLKRYWWMFNGQKIIGINYDDSTVSPDEFLRYCESIGLNWTDSVVRKNSPTVGEVLTWIPSLEFLHPESACSNEVVFSAHAKGVKYGSEMPPVIRDWTELMYSVNLSNWDRIKTSLEWFSATGAFRTRYRRSTSCRFGWYYSGAFWWWNLSVIGRRDWESVSPWYAGRELWIGNQLDKSEADCLFLDNCRSPYLQQYWRTVITPKWNQYNAR